MEINGKSIMGVMTLAAEFGSELELVADGVDETAGTQFRVVILWLANYRSIGNRLLKKHIIVSRTVALDRVLVADP